MCLRLLLVLYTPAHPFKQVIVLNKGANDGIEGGYRRSFPKGIVGQIRRVTARTAGGFGNG